MLTVHRCFWRSRWIGVASLLGVTLAAVPAFAHRAGIPLSLWGNFGAAAASCQRKIGLATARCASATWEVRGGCLAAPLAGGSCDTAAAAADIAQVHARTLGFLDDECAEDDVQALNFLQRFELYADIDSACSAATVALTSAVYGPAQRRATTAPLDAAAFTCVTSVARASTKMLRYAFATWRQVFDRIAITSVPPSGKTALVERARMMIGQAQVYLEPSVQADCPDAEFPRIYGRSVPAFLAAIATRADCLLAAGYVVDAGVFCPAPVCGNGMQEIGEQCDDGNTNDGDGCHSNCTLEP